MNSLIDLGKVVILWHDTNVLLMNVYLLIYLSIGAFETWWFNHRNMLRCSIHITHSYRGKLNLITFRKSYLYVSNYILLRAIYTFCTKDVRYSKSKACLELLLEFVIYEISWWYKSMLMILINTFMAGYWIIITSKHANEDL